MKSAVRLSTQLAAPFRREPLCWEFPLVVGILLVHAWLALWSSVNQSCTADELPHLAAGHAYWAHHAYQLQPENGILPQRWASLPAYVEGLPAPDPHHKAWQTSDIWTVGEAYLYENTQTPEVILFHARCAALVWNIALGFLIYFWSRALFGRRGAFFSLTLYALCPAFLANGPLITSDCCATFFLFASLGSFWRHLHRATPGSLLLSVLCFGLCCVAKFNAILLLPLFVCLLLIAWLAHRRGTPVALFEAPLRNLSLGLTAHLLGALLIIWSFYGFESGNSPSFQSDHFTWSEIAQGLQGKATILKSIADLHLLPKYYVHGFATVLHMSQQRGAFLNGECSVTGWPEFFPFTFLVKSTLTLLLITAVLVIWSESPLRQMLRQLGLHRRLSERSYHCLPLMLFFLFYWASSITLKLNIGHRHILPTYPVLYILAGSLGAWLLYHRSFWLRSAALLLLCTQAVENAAIAPHYLANFNLLIGGPNHGYEHLVDSSLDWGQDLPGLQDWLEQDPQTRSGAPVHLAYFGIASIPRHVPKAGILINIMVNRRPGDSVDAKAGLYCISATMLQQSYIGPRDWSEPLEKEFQHLRPYAEHHFQTSARLDSTRPPSFEETRFWRNFERLRFMRLANYLRTRQPEAQIGHSILIYRLSEAEAHAAVHGSWSEWARACSTH